MSEAVIVLGLVCLAFLVILGWFVYLDSQPPPLAPRDHTPDPDSVLDP
jgi:hypothetical protein